MAFQKVAYVFMHYTGNGGEVMCFALNLTNGNTIPVSLLILSFALSVM